MELATIKATLRSDRGKGAARRMRRDAQIPAIAYGKDLKPVALAVSPKALKDVLTSKYGLNSVIKLEIDGGEAIHTLVAEYQYHPVSRDLLHVDFRRVDLDKPIDVNIPFEVKGKSKGVVLGGELRVIYRSLPVSCLPEQVPTKIVHDVTELGLEESVLVKDISLPEGVSVRMGENRTVVTVAPGRIAKATDEEEAEKK